MQCEIYHSPMGPLWLAGEGGVLKELSFLPLSGEPARENAFEAVRQWLDGYFRGEDTPPDFPMDPEGTPFQKLIWSLLLEIPMGQTRSYGSLARQAAQILGKERMSAQAVGQAVGKNPIAIAIPCHRVLGSRGQLTGYASGLERKIRLLQHEGCSS